MLISSIDKAIHLVLEKSELLCCQFEKTYGYFTIDHLQLVERLIDPILDIFLHELASVLVVDVDVGGACCVERVQSSLQLFLLLEATDLLRSFVGVTDHVGVERRLAINV